MDATTLRTLCDKEADGTITQDEYVALLRERDGEDEDQAQRMYQTWYAPSHVAGWSETWVN